MVNANTVLGFDFGTKRIGIAVGQTITRTATPLTVIQYKLNQIPWHEIADLIRKWRPFALIVGKPLNMDGTSQPLTTIAHEFATTLQQQFALPVYEVDERLTTVSARADVFAAGGYRALRKKPIDNIAAQIILQEWLDSAVL